MTKGLMVSYPEILGQTIRNKRKEMQLEQTALAERTGMLQSTISRIERGEALFNSEQIVRLADALRLSPSDFWVKADDVKKAVEARGVTILRDRISSHLVRSSPFLLTGMALTGFIASILGESEDL
jgi:transcriptional regulator with XRE-family HTH domain